MCTRSRDVIPPCHPPHFHARRSFSLDPRAFVGEDEPSQDGTTRTRPLSTIKRLTRLFQHQCAGRSSVSRTYRRPAATLRRCVSSAPTPNVPTQLNPTQPPSLYLDEVGARRGRRATRCKVARRSLAERAPVPAAGADAALYRRPAHCDDRTNAAAARAASSLSTCRPIRVAAGRQGGAYRVIS